MNSNSKIAINKRLQKNHLKLIMHLKIKVWGEGELEDFGKFRLYLKIYPGDGAGGPLGKSSILFLFR
jgi:hypothetical protein